MKILLLEIYKISHEFLLLMKFLQTKPQVENMKINCFDLYCTVSKIGDEKENRDDKNENDYINFTDFIIPNHKSRETTLR